MQVNQKCKKFWGVIETYEPFFLAWFLYNFEFL